MRFGIDVGRVESSGWKGVGVDVAGRDVGACGCDVGRYSRCCDSCQETSCEEEETRHLGLKR